MLLHLFWKTIRRLVLSLSGKLCSGTYAWCIPGFILRSCAHSWHTCRSCRLIPERIQAIITGNIGFSQFSCNMVLLYYCSLWSLLLIASGLTEIIFSFHHFYIVLRSNNAVFSLSLKMSYTFNQMEWNVPFWLLSDVHNLTFFPNSCRTGDNFNLIWMVGEQHFIVQNVTLGCKREYWDEEVRWGNKYTKKRNVRLMRWKARECEHISMCLSAVRQKQKLENILVMKGRGSPSVVHRWGFYLIFFCCALDHLLS